MFVQQGLWSVFIKLYCFCIPIWSYDGDFIINRKINPESLKLQSFLNLATTSLFVMELPCVYFCIVKIGLRFNCSPRTRSHPFTTYAKFSKKLIFLKSNKKNWRILFWLQLNNKYRIWIISLNCHREILSFRNLMLGEYRWKHTE